MTDRVKCLTPDCEGIILSSTAERTGGFCMPCVQKKEREARERYIRENRRDVDLYDGITDLVEIIKIKHQSRKCDPLIRYLPYPKSLEELYREIDEDEAARLIDFAIDEAKSGREEPIESICLELAAYTKMDLSKLQEFMLQQHEYYPPNLFKGAGENIAAQLLSRLETEPENRNHLLPALAWTGEQSVVRQFVDWQVCPPQWSEDLYIAPQNYAKDAGWIIDDQNRQRQLYFDTCYSLLPADKGEVKPHLSTCTTSNGSCGWCQRELTDLFVFDLSDPVFDFIPLTGTTLKVATCDVCACYTDAIFMEVSTQGGVKWSSFNAKPDYLPDDLDDYERLPVNCLVMSDETRAPEYAANEFLPTTFSQIGGMPTWIQDFAYPDCPKCRETMIFLAQISNEDIDEYGEGIYYSYICPDCQITATNYQQT